MKNLLFAIFTLLISINASAGIYGKEATDITCADIKLLSDEQLKVLSMGIIIGATAESVSVSKFDNIVIQTEDVQDTKDEPYLYFSNLTPEIIVNVTKEECESRPAEKQVVEILVGHINYLLLFSH